MSVDYRYKPDKHKYRETPKSIDELHKEHVVNFKRSRDTIPQKYTKLKNLENELYDLKNTTNDGPINLDIPGIKKKNSLKKSIRILKDEIYNAENYNAEMDYYSRAGDVIYDYYELTNGVLYNKFYDMEEKKKEKKQTKVKISEELLAITHANKKRKLKRPVKKRNKKEELKPSKTIMSYLLGSENEGNQENQDNNMCRATLQDEYLVMIDKEYACSKNKINLIRKCKICDIDKIIIYAESIMTCPECGESDEIFIESEVPSNTESFNEKPKYPYKRIGHCIEKLNQFLCKGTSNVPHEVFGTLEEEILKHSLDKDMITIQFLEKMLKKHKLSDYYENIMYIFSKITNTSPQTITREEYELVLKMFREADEVYEEKFKPKDRNNFLKYTFVLNKIFLTLGKPQHAVYFKLLKSAVKMKEQETIWKQICKEKGWVYHSS